MVECVRASAASGAPAIIARIIDELRSFVGSQPQNDDITLIAIRKT
jgi:serine phosphatase RsbU (regulator of sigma subunit)